MIEVKRDPAMYPTAVPLIPNLGIRKSQKARHVRRPMTPDAVGIPTNAVPEKALTE
jgi:hypothetical protein